MTAPANWHRPVRPRYLAWCAVLAVHAALASQDTQARARPDAATGYNTPSISAQGLQPPALQANSPARPIERDIAQLLERAERAERPGAVRNTPPAHNRARIDTGPIASPAEAAWLLGLIYAHGAGVPQDGVLAQLWFERAAAKGHTQAAVGLAWCALEGCKSPRDTALAHTRLAALPGFRSHQNARALYLDWLIAQQSTPLAVSTPRGIAQNESAYQLPERSRLVQAAQLGDIHALLELGLEAVALGQSERARQFFEQAAAGGSVAASHNLRLLAQQQSAKDAPSPAYDTTDATSLLRMAQRNHRGQGQPANYSEAIRLYRMAQAQGSTAARDMLALIFSRPAANGQLDIAWMQRIAPLQGPNLAGRAGMGAGEGAGAPLFQRERSPLFDYLPALWKSRVAPIL
jgi:uncharacterized protein